MKILITGAKGLLGSNLALMYSKNYEVIATGINAPNFKFCKNYKLDITEEKDLKIIKDEKPDLLINCAAITDMDFCEENPLLAQKINSNGAKNLAKICKQEDIFLVHISTDAVFDGNKGNYSEEDSTNPLSVYGKTKLYAEQYIKKFGGRYCIIRTNLYGWNFQKKFSLAEWILNKLEKKESFPAFSDISFSPILTTNLGRAILEIYNSRIQGILNVAGSQTCTKLEFAYKIAEIFELDKNLIVPSTSEKFPFKAKRGKNMGLNTKKASYLLKTKLLNLNKGLEEFKISKKKIK